MRRYFDARIALEVTLADADHDDDLLSASPISASPKDFFEDLPSLGVKNLASGDCAHRQDVLAVSVACWRL